MIRDPLETYAQRSLFSSGAGFQIKSSNRKPVNGVFDISKLFAFFDRSIQASFKGELTIRYLIGAEKDLSRHPFGHDRDLYAFLFRIS